MPRRSKGESGSDGCLVVPLTSRRASINWIQLFELDVFAPQHQLKRITRLEPDLLGVGGPDQQLTIRLHGNAVTRTAAAPLTLSGWPVQWHAFRFQKGLQKLHQVDALPTTLRHRVIAAGFRFLGLTQGG